MPYWGPQRGNMSYGGNAPTQSQQPQQQGGLTGDPFSALGARMPGGGAGSFRPNPGVGMAALNPGAGSVTPSAIAPILQALTRVNPSGQMYQGSQFGPGLQAPQMYKPSQFGPGLQAAPTTAVMDNGPSYLTPGISQGPGMGYGGMNPQVLMALASFLGGQRGPSGGY